MTRENARTSSKKWVTALGLALAIFAWAPLAQAGGDKDKDIDISDPEGAVPEPNAFLAFAAGAGALGWAINRRRQR